MFYLENTWIDSRYGEIARGELLEKKSKFLSYVFTIHQEEEAIQKIEKIKQDHKDARHVVYLYSVLEQGVNKIRFSDDGEPKGTGTKAIYELLTKEEITNICIIIIRYFGGILLGAGPLSRAYLNTTREALILCQKQTLYLYEDREVILEYASYEIVKQLLQPMIELRLVEIVSTAFADKVMLHLKIEKTRIEEVLHNISEYVLEIK